MTEGFFKVIGFFERSKSNVEQTKNDEVQVRNPSATPYDTDEPILKEIFLA
jgi:hypothetical protein